MKNNRNKGFAPIFIILIVVAVGAITYAVVPKTVLKDFFEKGDKPTQQQFSDTIDSALNLQDDGISTAKKEYSPTKEYAVGDTAVKNQPIYQAKVLTQAETEFKLDADQAVTFKWTPIVSKPQEPTTYRLKVWQLMQGQSGSQAMKANQPIATKEVVDGTEATLSGIYTGPCRPPYLCDFIWSVEVVAKAESTTGTSGSAGAPAHE